MAPGRAVASSTKTNPRKTLLTKDMTLLCDDALRVARSLPSASLDLIVVDPPYYKVKDDDWDHQWPTAEAFTAWLEECVTEFRRLLKPNGSIYLFCSSQMSTDVELMMRKHLRILNHIVWAKPNGRWNGCNKESLRRYFPATERIIFAEPHGADGAASHRSGYRAACHDLRRQVFSPLIEYFRSAKEAAGVTAADIYAATGVNMASHWFGYSQWQLPSQEQYEKLQALFADRLGEDYQALAETYQGLHKTYQGLAASYDQLKADFDQLRRPFSVTKHVPYTDVWTYPVVQHYQGKHPCEKPALMMEHIIQASSRPGDLVADFFMGSGATGKAALRLGRRFLGVELDKARFEQTRCEFIQP